jgi:hypothetical protein
MDESSEDDRPAMDYQLGCINSYEPILRLPMPPDVRSFKEWFDTFAPVMDSIAKKFQADMALWQKAIADSQPATDQLRRTLMQ